MNGQTNYTSRIQAKAEQKSSKHQRKTFHIKFPSVFQHLNALPILFTSIYVHSEQCEQWKRSGTELWNSNWLVNSVTKKIFFSPEKVNFCKSLCEFVAIENLSKNVKTVNRKMLIVNRFYIAMTIHEMTVLIRKRIEMYTEEYFYISAVTIT